MVTVVDGEHITVSESADAFAAEKAANMKKER
jgi:hypothetical protein